MTEAYIKNAVHSENGIRWKQGNHHTRYEFTRLRFPVMILSFRTDMPGQTVQTQIRLLEQSDQGLHCLPVSLHRLDAFLYGRAT